LNFEHFQQIQNSTSVLSAFLSNVNSWKIRVQQLISYGMQQVNGYAETAREHRQTFFSQIQPVTQHSY